MLPHYSIPIIALSADIEIPKPPENKKSQARLTWYSILWKGGEVNERE
jgi:hypothetical protein